MKKYEYNVLKMDVRGGFFSGGGVVDADSLQAKLDSLGKEGWELVNTFDTNMQEGRSRDLILIFKREVE